MIPLINISFHFAEFSHVQTNFCKADIKWAIKIPIVIFLIFRFDIIWNMIMVKEIPILHSLLPFRDL